MLSLRCDDCDDSITRHQHHLDPAKLVIDAARKDMPHPALVKRLSPLPGSLRLANFDASHADIPQVRIISMPSSLSRAFVHTGSHTTSICTVTTPGSRSKRSRISSSINSVAGQPIAVKVSLTLTTFPCLDSATISPIATTLIGISGSATSRSASHRAGQLASSAAWVCKEGYAVVMHPAPDH